MVSAQTWLHGETRLEMGVPTGITAPKPSPISAFQRTSHIAGRSLLHQLEVGMHAPNSGLSGSEYARRVGIPQGALKDQICAARVAGSISGHPLNKTSQLTAIHAALRCLCSATRPKRRSEKQTAIAATNQYSEGKQSKFTPNW